MNTVLSTPVDEHNHTRPPSPLDHRSNARTVSLADRAALHLGVALITWSRRPRTVAPQPTEDDLWMRNERARERVARERLWTEALYLSQPRR
jgi:hypothetical protein